MQLYFTGPFSSSQTVNVVADNSSNSSISKLSIGLISTLAIVFIVAVLWFAYIPVKTWWKKHFGEKLLKSSTSTSL